MIRHHLFMKIFPRIPVAVAVVLLSQLYAGCQPLLASRVKADESDSNEDLVDPISLDKIDLAKVVLWLERATITGPSPGYRKFGDTYWQPFEPSTLLPWLVTKNSDPMTSVIFDDKTTIVETSGSLAEFKTLAFKGTAGNELLTELPTPHLASTQSGRSYLMAARPIVAPSKQSPGQVIIRTNLMVADNLVPLFDGPTTVMMFGEQQYSIEMEYMLYSKVSGGVVLWNSDITGPMTYTFNESGATFVTPGLDNATLATEHVEEGTLKTADGTSYQAKFTVSPMQTISTATVSTGDQMIRHLDVQSGLLGEPVAPPPAPEVRTPVAAPAAPVNTATATPEPVAAAPAQTQRTTARGGFWRCLVRRNTAQLALLDAAGSGGSCVDDDTFSADPEHGPAAADGPSLAELAKVIISATDNGATTPDGADASGASASDRDAADRGAASRDSSAARR